MNIIKFKKFSKILGAGLSVFIPLSATISCGGVDSSKILQVAIKPESIESMEKIKTQWEKGNPGYKIKWREIQNDINVNGTLDSWKASDSLPDVVAIDTTWAATYTNRGWLEPIDLKDIATNPIYKFNNDLVDQKFKEKDITELNFEKEFTKSINDSKIGENKWAHFATSVGPQLGYIWGKAKDRNGNIVDILDGKHDLHWYVPNTKPASQKNIDEVSSFNKGTQSPLYKPGTKTKYKNTLEDIIEFINNSARKDQLIFNGNVAKSYNSINANSGPEDFVFSTGYFGQTQRMISVLLTIKNAFDLDYVPMDGEFWLSFLGLLQGQSPFSEDENQKNSNASENGSLDDDKIFDLTGTKRDKTDYKINLNKAPQSKVELSQLEMQMWYGQLGYYQDGVVKIPKAIDSNYQVGQGEGLGNGKSIGIGSGGGWMYTWLFGYKRPQQEWREGINTFGLDAIHAIPLPFEFAGTGGYSVVSGLSKDKEVLAKNFIRFTMQKEVQNTLNGTSTIATRIESLQEQKNKFPKGLSALTKSGGNTAKNLSSPNDYISSIIYNAGKRSSKNTYPKYNESFFKNTAWSSKKLLDNPEANFDISEYVNIIQRAIKNYKTRIAAE